MPVNQKEFAMRAHHAVRIHWTYKYGRRFAWRPLPANVEKGEPRQCYRNAAELSLQRPELTYCEGLVSVPPEHLDRPPVPWDVVTDGGHYFLPHAFCIDENDSVIDNTPSMMTCNGISVDEVDLPINAMIERPTYIGVAIPRDWVVRGIDQQTRKMNSILPFSWNPQLQRKMTDEEVDQVIGEFEDVLREVVNWTGGRLYIAPDKHSGYCPRGKFLGGQGTPPMPLMNRAQRRAQRVNY